MTIPPVVSFRNHFTVADELVERAMYHLPVEFHVPTFRPWLLRYTETAIHSVAISFSTAAQRGIEQTANLLCNPAYYEKKKERRKREEHRSKNRQAADEFEREQRRIAPTAEQIEQLVRWHEAQRDYYQKRLEEHEIALAKLAVQAPHIIAPVAKRVQ